MFLQAALDGLERATRGSVAPLDPCAHTREFVDRYALTLDGRRYDWEAYPHLIDWYEDTHPMQVAMAGAQTGKSGRMFAELARLAIVFWGKLIAYYFPDATLAASFSRTRIAPFMKSNAELAALWGKDLEGESTDAIGTRAFGATTLFFMTIKGKTATEGLPLSAVMLDEVRRMEPGDIQRAEQRYAAQTEYADWRVSTAYLPDSDIHAYFKAGDQRFFHTACKCPDGVVLSLTFPNCVADLSKATPELRRKVEHAYAHARLPFLGMSDQERRKFGEAAYLCPTCGEIIVNPRRGWWEAHNPSAYVHSWQHPQLLSPSFPAARCWQAWNKQTTEAVDIREVYNSMLGLPWVDPSSTPITDDVLRASMRDGLPWLHEYTPRELDDTIRASAMGVDVQKGYLVVLILCGTNSGQVRLGLLAILHAENSRNGDPWQELDAYMFRFKVRAAIVDAQPEFGPAARFALRHRGKVWVCYYNENEKGLVVDWKDRKKPAAGDKSVQDLSEKYRVAIQRSKGLHWALHMWAMHRVETPKRPMLQNLPKQGGRPAFTGDLNAGTWEPVDLLQEALWWHLKSVIFEKVYSSEDARREGRYAMKALHVGTDPHYAHAWLYAVAAFSRIAGRARAALGLDESEE